MAVDKQLIGSIALVPLVFTMLHARQTKPNRAMFLLSATVLSLLAWDAARVSHASQVLAVSSALLSYQLWAKMRRDFLKIRYREVRRSRKSLRSYRDAEPSVSGCRAAS